MKIFVFQAYGVKNIKFVASERRSSNIVPEIVLFPKMYKKCLFFNLFFEKWLIFLCQQILVKWMNCLTLNFFSSSKITYGQLLLRFLFIFQSFPYVKSSTDIFQFLEVYREMLKINWTPKICKWNFVYIFPNFTPSISWSYVSYIFQYTFWVAINTIWWSDFRCPILVGISLLLKCNKMMHASISSLHRFLLFLMNWFAQILHKLASIIPKK